jgi:hypothetical protein
VARLAEAGGVRRVVEHATYGRLVLLNVNGNRYALAALKAKRAEVADENKGATIVQAAAMDIQCAALTKHRGVRLRATQ